MLEQESRALPVYSPLFWLKIEIRMGQKLGQKLALRKLTVTYLRCLFIPLSPLLNSDILKEVT